MAKIKVAEATGSALNWLVARCEGYELQLDDEVSGPWLVPVEGYFHDQKPLTMVKYSTDWTQGGPIIAREDISFRKYHNPSSEAHGKYYARICRESGTLVGWYQTTGFQQTGPTPLIAAMRCFVASKLGEEVEVHNELLD